MFEKIRIDTARIDLTAKPNWLSEKSSFAWNLKFTEMSSTVLGDSYPVCVGKVEDEATIKFSLLKENFENANISNQDKVVVLSGARGNIKAIGSTVEGGKWIDVSDDFSIKSFDELEVQLTPPEKDLLKMLKAC